jgi:hypothetical protein
LVQKAGRSNTNHKPRIGNMTECRAAAIKKA